MKANKVRIKLNFCTYRTMDNIILLCLNLLPSSLWILSSNKYKVLKKTKLKDFYTWRGKKNFSKLFSSKTPKQCMLNFWRNILLVTDSIYSLFTSGIKGERTKQLCGELISKLFISAWAAQITLDRRKKWTGKMHKKKCYGYYLAI